MGLPFPPRPALPLLPEVVLALVVQLGGDGLLRLGLCAHRVD